MVEIKIAVEADELTGLQEILEHVVKEITDNKYRANEITELRTVDLNWVYLADGKYQWFRYDRT